MIIYKITNKINGKCYIGQTIYSLAHRWSGHNVERRGCVALQEALKKYGKENFCVEELVQCKSLQELNNTEEYFISYYNCIAPNGYNIEPGGNNKTHSAETRRKIGLGNKGKIISAKTKIKMSAATKGEKNPFYGRKHSSETKLKISIANKGKLSSKKNPFYGKTHSPETRLKMSNAVKEALSKKCPNVK